MTPRHIAKVAGVQGARERPLRPPSGPSRAARTPVRERMFNRMDRMFKQNEHSLGCSSWIVAIQSLSGDSRRSAWRTCQHQPLTDPNTSCTTCVIMANRVKLPKRALAVNELLRGTLSPCNPCGRDCLQARSRCQDGGLWAAPEALARLDCARCIPGKRATPFSTTAPLDPSSPAIFCIRRRLKLHSGS